MTDSGILAKISTASEERQVEDAYNEVFEKMFHGIRISYPFKCDGYFEFEDIRVLIEYKFDSDYSNRMEMAKTVLQILFYLKRFEQNGRKFPSVLFVGDRNECFVFKKLQTTTLSPEAQAVLDKANELVRKSFKYRSLFNDSHPEYQCLNWDASYYQLKPIWREFLPENFKEFKELYKKLSDKMRPMVYELGFLRR